MDIADTENDDLSTGVRPRLATYQGYTALVIPWTVLGRRPRTSIALASSYNADSLTSPHSYPNMAMSARPSPPEDNEMTG